MRVGTPFYCALFVGGVGFGAIAFAASPPLSLAIIGSTGSGPGHFSSPFGLVEDQGLLYVADYGNQRIQVLTPAGEPRLTIVDVGGRRLGSWHLAGGEGGFRWDGNDRSGRSAPSGTYFARLEAGPIAVSRAFRILR